MPCVGVMPPFFDQTTSPIARDIRRFALGVGSLCRYRERDRHSDDCWILKVTHA